MIGDYLISHGASLWSANGGGLFNSGGGIDNNNNNGGGLFNHNNGGGIFHNNNNGGGIFHHNNNGGDVNKENNYGYTPLFIVSRYGYLEVVKYLVEHGADVNKVEKYGNTPLSVSKNQSIKDYLISHGAHK